MRRTMTIAAVAAAVFVAVPALGIGQTGGDHSGSPSDVYTQTNPDECLPGVGGVTGTAMQQEISVAPQANVLVTFTVRWGRLETKEEALASFSLQAGEGSEVFDSPEWSMSGTASTRTTQTITWSFVGVAPEAEAYTDYNVYVFGRVDPLPGGPPGSVRPVADMTACSLSVFVMPPA